METGLIKQNYIDELTTKEVVAAQEAKVAKRKEIQAWIKKYTTCEPDSERAKYLVFNYLQKNSHTHWITPRISSNLNPKEFEKWLKRSKRYYGFLALSCDMFCL